MQLLKGFGGWIRDLPDHRDHLFIMDLERARIQLPSKVDLRDQFPPAYYQDNLKSCTANAIAAVIEFERKKQHLLNLMPSRLFIYYNEREMEGTVSIDSGAQTRDGIKGVAKQGVCDEAEWPYDITKFAIKPPSQCYQNAIKDRVVSYRRLKHDLDSLKACLASNQPFVFGLMLYDSFATVEVARTGNVPMPEQSEHSIGGHALVAVGYDDSQQRFITRSSSGPKWGMQGYCTLPYSYVIDPNLTDDFWEIKLISQG